MTPIETALSYFEVSNISDFDRISELFTESSTYSSQNTGLYVWIDDIIAMQKTFHNSFERLNWEIKSISEEKPWIIRVDFDFSGTKKDWEELNFSGIEYVIVVNDKIQHIEIRNK